jgi:hypothetical protein
MRILRVWLPVLSAALLLVMGLVAPAIASEIQFFPIGLFEAGVYPRDSRRCCSSPLELCRVDSSDTSWNAPEWSALDEIRGDWPGAPDTMMYGYTSGFNVVQDYFYKSTLTFSFWDVKRYVDLAAAYGLKVILGLPGAVGDGDTLSLEERLHFLQQSPPVYQPGIDLIQKFKNEANLYGWYMVDEPANILDTADPGCKDDGFHSTGVSPLSLKAALQEFKDYDDEHPYIFTTPDYNIVESGYRKDEFSVLGYWSQRPIDDYWRWDNDPGHTMEEVFPDPCHGEPLEIPMTQDYSQSADVIQNDTYVSPAMGESQANLAWSNLLHQYDEAVASKGGGIQAVLAIASCSNPPNCSDCADTTYADCVRFSLEALRFQAFSAIIHGVSGIWFWSYGKTFDPCASCNACERYYPNDSNSYFVDTLVPLSQQLDSLDTYFVADEIGRYAWGTGSGSRPTVKNAGGSAEPRIHLTLRELDGRVVMIAANVADTTLDIHFNFGDLPVNPESRAVREAVSATRLYPAPGESPSVWINEHELQDEFDPFEVKIYRFRQLTVPGDASTIDEAIEQASPGDVVAIEEPTSIPSLTVPDGVFLRADVPNVIVDANGGATAVTISLQTTPGGGLSGITIRDFQTRGIRAEAGGTEGARVEKCIIEMGTGNDDRRGIQVTNTEIRVLDSIVRCSLANSSKAILLSGTREMTVENCTLVGVSGTSSTRAIDVITTAADVRLVGNTIRGFYLGISLAAGLASTGSVERNLVTGCGGTGIISATGGGTILHNDSWGNPSNYFWSGSGVMPTANLSEDPRLCPSGESDIDLTSPCARWGNEWGEWIGANQFVSCAAGALDKTVHLLPSDLVGNTITLVSDLEVSSGKSLTIDPAIVVRVDQADETNLGVNSAENEIVLVGRLVVNGTSGSKVVFRSTAASPIAGDWGGFYVKNGGDLKLTYADVSHATYGVLAVALADTISLTNTSIDSCQQMVVQVNNRCTPYFPETCTSTRLLISGGTISTNTATHGILTYFPLEVTVVGTTITGSASAFYGIFADTMGSGAADAEIKNCTITGLTAGTGIYVNHGSPALKSNWVKDCKWGVQLRGPGTPVVQRATVSGIGTRLDHCATGLYVQSASASVDSVSVEPGGLSGAICVSSAGASGGTYTKLKLLGGTVGFVASSTASPAPTLRNSQILGFTINGTKHEGTAGLDLGTVASVGNNWIESSGASGKWVLVKTCPSGGATLPARYNYWGGDPISSKFSACVDYSNWLSSQQSALIIQHAGVATSPRPFVATPNPFTGGVSFSFSVGTEGARSVRLKLFDLAGRLVRTVAEAEMTPGEYELAWDGRDDAGVVVGSGIYFARFQVGSELTTVKVIKLP